MSRKKSLKGVKYVHHDLEREYEEKLKKEEEIKKYIHDVEVKDRMKRIDDYNLNQFSKNYLDVKQQLTAQLSERRIKKLHKDLEISKKLKPRESKFSQLTKKEAELRKQNQEQSTEFIKTKQERRERYYKLV